MAGISLVFVNYLQFYSPGQCLQRVTYIVYRGNLNILKIEATATEGKKSNQCLQVHVTTTQPMGRGVKMG